MQQYDLRMVALRHRQNKRSGSARALGEIDGEQDAFELGHNRYPMLDGWQLTGHWKRA
jgi:hypothetical protein